MTYDESLFKGEYDTFWYDPGEIYDLSKHIAIQLETGIDLTDGVDSVYIKYKAPGVEKVGGWAGKVIDTTLIRVDMFGGLGVLANNPGRWNIWACVKLSDGTYLSGKPTYITVR